MPIYSFDDGEYRRRVHANGRSADQVFGPVEVLFRRFPKEFLVNGWPVPLNIPFDATGISVNRSKYSIPEDVLEPDCCGGNIRSGQVVLEFLVDDLPAELPEDDPKYRFALKHDPCECCYAHSVIWCNIDGDIGSPCLKPSKTVRDLFRAQLLIRMQEAGRVPREITPLASAG